MSYVRELLYSIADQIGKPRKQMDGFIANMEKNWYDSKQAIQSMNPKDFDKLGIPSRLASIVMDRVGKAQDQAMDVESSVQADLTQLKRKLPATRFDEIINDLHRIFANLRNNSMDPKYRTLKKSNKKIQGLVQYKQVQRILCYGGFSNRPETFSVETANFGKLDQCLSNIARFLPKQNFNPYKASITSLEAKNDVRNYEGESSVSFNEKLEQLEKERTRLMSKPIKDRDVKIFKQKKQDKMDVQSFEEKQSNEDQKLFMQSVKEKLKNYGEDPKFMNRRKQQYFDLLKQPCFSQTIIRVKMPEDYIFEAKFSPLETMQDLVNFFDQFVQDRNIFYYLYMTPPVQKLTGMTLSKTFYELGCLPKAIFYFKTEAKIDGNILKAKKSKIYYKMQATTIKKIRLESKKIQINEFSHSLADSFRNKEISIKALQSISIEGNSYSVDFCQQFSKYLGQANNIKDLNINDIFVSRLKEEIPKSIEFISAGLITKQLIRLDISNNAVNPYGAKALLIYLSQAKSLEMLLAYNCGLGPLGVAQIAKGLEGTPNLKTLSIGRNRMENEGIEHIAASIKHVPLLEQLFAYQNTLKEGLTNLLREIKKNCKNITALDLCDNFIRDQATHELCELLTNNLNLVRLNVSDSLNEDQNQQIVEAFEKTTNRSFEKLGFNYIEIEPELAERLLTVLKECPISKLDFIGNDLPKKLRKQFASLSQKNEAVINLQQNEEQEQLGAVRLFEQIKL